MDKIHSIRTPSPDGLLRRGLWSAVIAGFVANVVSAQTATPCATLDSGARARLVQVAARQLRTEPAVPVIDRESFVPGTCYLQLFVSVPGSNRKVILYLSPDRRFLSTGIWDISSDPQTTEAELAIALIRESKDAHAPMNGSDAAPATVVVFSDFQCPYCSAFAAILRRYQRLRPNDIRLIFRNLPLPDHNWAPHAARIAVCVAQQSGSTFWSLHDALFANQKTISLESLGTTTDRLLSKEAELDPSKYLRCMASSYPDTQLERDRSDARLHDVHGTPTVFINGRKYAGFRDDAAFLTAIDLAIRPN